MLSSCTVYLYLALNGALELFHDFPSLLQSVTDMSPYVRKTAAHAIPKLYRSALDCQCFNETGH